VNHLNHSQTLGFLRALQLLLLYPQTPQQSQVPMKLLIAIKTSRPLHCIHRFPIMQHHNHLQLVQRSRPLPLRRLSKVYWIRKAPKRRRSCNISTSRAQMPRRFSASTTRRRTRRTSMKKTAFRTCQTHPQSCTKLSKPLSVCRQPLVLKEIVEKVAWLHKRPWSAPGWYVFTFHLINDAHLHKQEFVETFLKSGMIKDSIVDEHSLLLFIKFSAERPKRNRRGIDIPGTFVGAVR
jgi:hypothetical protein